MAFSSLSSAYYQRIGFCFIIASLFLFSMAWADTLEAELLNAQPTLNKKNTVEEGISLLATANSKQPLWELSVDGLMLQPNRFLTATSSPRFLARPITQSNQWLIEFPNAALKAGIMPQLLTGFINQNGIQRISITPHNGSLTHSVRVLIAYAPQVSIEKLAPVKLANQTLVVPFPIITSSNTSHKTAGTIQGTAVVPYKFNKIPTTANEARDVAPPVLATTLSTDEPKVPLKGLEVESEFLLLKPAEGAGTLKVKNQFYLEKPNRFVVDLEPAVLSGDLFTGQAPTPTGNAPTSGVTQWNGWTVRLSQNTPSIVRLVIETEGNKNFKLLEGSPQAPLAFRNALVVQPTTGIKFPVKDPISQVAVAKGNLTQVYFSPPTSKGAVKMRLEASVPVEYKITNETAQRLVLSLPNIAPPEGGGVQLFDVKSFPYLKSLSHVAAVKGSALLIDFAQPVKDLRSLPYTAQRALELSFLVPNNPASITASIRNPKGRIVIDAGHGGKDQGASRVGVLEKDLNLACATYLIDALKRRGLEVYATRSTDKFLELKEISAIANKYDPDLFVSIHHNSSTDPSIAGLETYYYHYPSVALAKAVHASLVGALPVKDRGVRRAQFYVINHTTAPAILVEMGYVSNAGERAEVNTTARQKKSAEAIAEGIMDYLRQLKR
ncbi:MAG: N-acetylmuramoyl-L-alanine amidase [Candidatus Melainabacteria bacterium]|nr:N-acetylmuramoyl-L-alanine amidase [Candidatus Melainabacteria bacterium]